jgi:hypothetical protein
LTSWWHAPLILLYGYNFPGHPWLGIGVMVLGAMVVTGRVRADTSGAAKSRLH